ncbi:MAG: ParA family protein, partial [Chloroflexia bacterium]
HLPGRTFRTLIPRTIRLGEAPSHGRTIWEYDAHSYGALAYERLGQEFLLRLGFTGPDDLEEGGHV